MFGAIRYSLANLLNVNGRDARQTFWYYVLAIVVAQFVAGLAISVPVMVETFTTVFQAARGGMHGAVLEQQLNAQMMGKMTQMMWFSMAISIACALLLVSALVRRLHDSDHSGWWTVLPFALFAYALSRAPEQMERAIAMMDTAGSGTPPDPMAMLQGQAGDTLISWLPYLIVIVIGVLKSTPGPNRFGDSPVSF
jgi:uncharacterized membrane protein YhaH (DUF805 family)